MEERCENFQAKMIPWNQEFRVLFGKPGQMSEFADPKVH